MKTLDDKTEVLIDDKPLIINPRTVNNYQDNSSLLQDELSEGQNIILDDGIIEKIPGTTKANSDTPGNPVTGLHRAYSKTTDKVCLRLANGSLKSGPAAFGTTVLTGLSTSKITPFINIKGKSYGVNETDGLIRYDTKNATGVLSGVVGPNLRKKIAFMESDESWTGGSADTGNYRPEEWSGKSITSRLVTAVASGNTVTTHDVVVNLAIFDNSKVSDVNDTISFWTKHTLLGHLDYVTIEFSTGDATYTVKFMATILARDFTQKDYEWTFWQIKKDVFALTGAADWATVKSVRFTVYANANGAVSVNFDALYLAASPILSEELRIDIFNCESASLETWGGDTVLSTTEVYEGFQSAMVQGAGGALTASVVLTTAIDLTKWETGALTLDSDEIVFHIFCNDIAQLTNANCITLRVGQDSSNYYYYTWATKAALGLTASNQWLEVRLAKSDLITLSVGTPNLTAVDYVAFVTSVFATGAYYIYFDEMSLQKTNNYIQLATMEATETWVFSDAYISQGATYYGEAGVTEGVQCLRTYVDYTTYPQTKYAHFVFSPVLDLTLWLDGTISPPTDYITFDLFPYFDSLNFEYIEIWFDNNSLATFANAYKYRLQNNDFLYNQSQQISIKKEDFEKVGTSGGWDSIGAVKFVVRGNLSATANMMRCYFDNLRLTRRPRDKGTYYYKYSFMIGDVASALSLISSSVVNNGNDILLMNIKTSQDARVTSRRIYRLGGTFTDTWMLLAEIGDNTTTVYVDVSNDSDLTLSMGDEIPQGFINSVLGNNLCYDSDSDRLLVWGDPTNRNIVRYSAIGYYLVFSEDSYKEFQDEVMFCAPWYGQTIVFFKNRIQKVPGEFTTTKPVDLPINVGACSYWAVKPLKNIIPFAAWDNIYIMDGYQVQPIGDEVRGYFKGRESYLSTIILGFCKDSIYIACKDKTGTPTYNNIVLRYYLPKKSWTIVGWNVNVWSNWDQMDDQNELYYGDSNNGNIYSINYGTYQFSGSAITASLSTGWLMVPDSDVAIKKIELKAKGTTASILAFSGYKDFGVGSSCTGNITLASDWKTFTIGPKNVHSLLRGNALKINFTHATDNAYFKMKDVVIYLERIPRQITLNEVTVT